MNELIMIVKPSTDECCIVLFFIKDNKVYIHQAYMLDNITDCINKIKFILKNKEENYPVVSVRFDASIYIQEAFTLRSDLNVDVFLYLEKKKFEHRLATQENSIKSFVFRKTKTEEYVQFMTMFESFNKMDKYNIVVDVLCDIGKYYRIVKRD